MKKCIDCQEEIKERTTSQRCKTCRRSHRKKAMAEGATDTTRGRRFRGGPALVRAVGSISVTATPVLGYARVARVRRTSSRVKWVANRMPNCSRPKRLRHAMPSIPCAGRLRHWPRDRMCRWQWSSSGLKKENLSLTSHNMSVKILIGDALKELASMASESVHCCVTSPPYW